MSQLNAQPIEANFASSKGGFLLALEHVLYAIGGRWASAWSEPQWFQLDLGTTIPVLSYTSFGYRMQVRGFWWGSNSLVGMTAMHCLLAAELCDAPAQSQKYVDNHGASVTFKPGRKFQQVSRNVLENCEGNGQEVTQSTPIFDGDCLYLRGLDWMYCIGPIGKAEAKP